QVVDDQLVVINEFAQNGHNCFSGANLGAQETTAIVSEFLSRFPDEAGNGVIAIPDTMQDSKLRRMSPTLAALIELGDARARLVAQIRSRGIFHGFIELQQSRTTRDWSEQDGAVLQSVSEVLSLVVQQSFDLMRIEQDANEMKIVNEISRIFRESGGQRTQYTTEQAVNLFADHTGFMSAQVFLYEEEEYVLAPQIASKEHAENIPLNQKHNPFMQVFESGKLKIINQEYSKRGDSVFAHDTAMIIPLMSEGEKLGVLGLWKRKHGSPMLRPQDRELALTVAGNLASIIRAEQANALVRQKSQRESLINSVSEQIQQSLKEVNPILHTLVSLFRSGSGCGFNLRFSQSKIRRTTMRRLFHA
ncbi:MAG: GAF domain-containing protein, partial [Candidatus Obscuribacterales bacterium]|nr:GAF domain-containing protein [Candidatus Obscuribacterales bacterium]